MAAAAVYCRCVCSLAAVVVVFVWETMPLYFTEKKQNRNKHTLSLESRSLYDVTAPTARYGRVTTTGSSSTSLLGQRFFKDFNSCSVTYVLCKSHLHEKNRGDILPSSNLTAMFLSNAF